jgi:hypothetical protein
LATGALWVIKGTSDDRPDPPHIVFDRTDAAPAGMPSNPLASGGAFVEEKDHG